MSVYAYCMCWYIGWFVIHVIMSKNVFSMTLVLRWSSSKTGEAKEVTSLQPVLREQLSQKSTCISLLSLSVSSVAELSLLVGHLAQYLPAYFSGILNSRQIQHYRQMTAPSDAF